MSHVDGVDGVDGGDGVDGFDSSAGADGVWWCVVVVGDVWWVDNVDDMDGYLVVFLILMIYLMGCC